MHIGIGLGIDGLQTLEHILLILIESKAQREIDLDQKRASKHREKEEVNEQNVHYNIRYALRCRLFVPLISAVILNVSVTETEFEILLIVFVRNGI